MSVSTLILIAAAAAQAPAGSAAAAVSYSASSTDSGKLLVVGADASSGRTIRLKVFRNGFVSGKIGARTVRYWVSSAERERLARKASGGSAAS